MVARIYFVFILQVSYWMVWNEPTKYLAKTFSLNWSRCIHWSVDQPENFDSTKKFVHLFAIVSLWVRVHENIFNLCDIVGLFIKKLKNKKELFFVIAIYQA